MSLFNLSQIFGLLAAISMFISSYQKKRNKILFYLVFDNIFYFLQYLLLGAYSGALSNVVSLIRTLTFINKGKNAFFRTNVMLYIILILNILVGLITYNGILSILPIIASILYAIVLWQDNTKKIRIGTSLVLLIWVIYNLCINAYISFISYFILFNSYLIAIIKFDVHSIKNNKINELLTKEKNIL